MKFLRTATPIVFFICAVGYALLGNMDRGALFLILSYVSTIDNAVSFRE